MTEPEVQPEPIPFATGSQISFTVPKPMVVDRVGLHDTTTDEVVWVDIRAPHYCQVPPGHPNDDPVWTCPECQTEFELNVDAYYTERDSQWDGEAW